MGWSRVNDGCERAIHLGGLASAWDLAPNESTVASVERDVHSCGGCWSAASFRLSKVFRHPSSRSTTKQSPTLGVVMAVPVSKDQLYTQVLGIPHHECPPSHYRLLGLNQFEQDPALIRQAVQQRMGQIQYALRGPDAESMIRHVQEVGNVLLSPHLKQAYDGMLLQQSMGGSPPPGSPRQNEYDLKPSPPPPPAYRAPQPMSASEPAYGGTSPTSQPARTAPGAKRGKKGALGSSSRRSLKRRSIIRVPIWVRVVVIGGFLAAHGAIYWYAYDYINAPSQETNVAEAGTPANVASQPADPSANQAGTPLPRDKERITPPPANITPGRNPSAGNSVAPGILSPSGNGLRRSVPTPQPVATTSSGPAPRMNSAADLSPGMPTSGTSEPAISEPAPVVRKPFDTLEPYVGLPERSAATSTPEGAVVLGQIQGDAAAEVELELESSVVDLAGKQFHVATHPSENESEQQRHWDVTLFAPGAGSSGESKSVAHLHTDDEGQLKFHWDLEAEGAEADQLQNALLLCSHSEDSHVMALRKPTFLPSVALDLTSKKLESAVPLIAPPLAESIRLEFSLAKTPLTATAEPTDRVVPPSENMSFIMGDSDDLVEGELLISSKQESDHQLSVTVIPRYRQADSRKYSPLEHESLVQQIARLQRLLSDDAVDLAAAYTNLPNHYANLKKLQATRPRNNDEAGAKARTALQIEGYIKKCESAIRAKTRTMPSSYEALNRIIEAARLARQLNSKGEIEYRVFAETPRGPLVLAEAKRSTRLETGEDEFAFLDNTPGPVGTWVKLKPEFQIVELNSGGSVYTKDASGKKSLGSGRWNQNGDLIEISVNGTTGMFKFHNGVAMASDTGHTLFRKF